jgi:hypothetical protein
MRNKIGETDKIENLFLAKNNFHKEMAKLRFEKKIEILIRLQEIANDIKSVSGKRRGRVWGK